jgi:hypothetical protein
MHCRAGRGPGPEAADRRTPNSKFRFSFHLTPGWLSLREVAEISRHLSLAALERILDQDAFDIGRFCGGPGRGLWGVSTCD